MATNTTNFSLIKPAYTDTADIADINGNMDKVDVSLNGLADAIAIVANNNTHAAITEGQYVYVHGHGSLAEGLYTAKSNIAANATLSTSNLQADGSGGLNAFNSKFPMTRLSEVAFTGVDVQNRFLMDLKSTETANRIYRLEWMPSDIKISMQNNGGSWETIYSVNSKIEPTTTNIGGGCQLTKIGKWRIASFTNTSGEITSSGLSLPENNSISVCAPCRYYNGSSNVDGTIYVNNGKIYITNTTFVIQNSASYIQGQVIYTV